MRLYKRALAHSVNFHISSGVGRGALVRPTP